LEEAQKAHEEKWREINAREEQERATARQSFQECDVDSMTGEDFEQFLIRLFEKMGYVAVQVTSTMRPDFGVDIILRDHQDKPSLMIAVQAKRYTGNVGIEAVQEVFAGKRHHGCKKAVLVTNSAFSAAAMELAKSTGVTLIDGEALQKLCFEQSHRPFG
jgi:restriction system protein